jgi:hypothetical protein
MPATKVSRPAGLTDKFLEFTIEKNGSVSVEVHGVTDGSCHRATENYEKALGVVQNRKLKSQQCAQTVKNKAR